jgi:hypothetical protein
MSTSTTLPRITSTSNTHLSQITANTNRIYYKSHLQHILRSHII